MGERAVSLAELMSPGTDTVPVRTFCPGPHGMTRRRTWNGHVAKLAHAYMAVREIFTSLT